MSDRTEPRTVKATFTRFGETTSVKGVPKLLKSRRLHLKLLWTLAVLAGGTMALFQLVTLLINYFSFPTSTQLRQVDDPPEFPDVTFCNLNPFTRPMTDDVTPDYYSDQLMRYLVNERHLVEDEDFYNYFHGLSPNLSTVTNADIYETTSTIFSASGYYQSFPLDKSRSAALLQSMVSDMFMDCVFNSWDMGALDLRCNASTITPFFYPESQACFTVSVPDSYRHRVRGISGVLFLHEHIHVILPVFKLNVLHPKSRGVNVFLHPRHTLPDLTDGDAVAPGFDTTLRLNTAYINLLPHPYGECTEAEFLEHAQSSAEREGRRYLYTAETCMSHCYQEHVIKTCRCIDPIYGYTQGQLKENADLELCGNTTFMELDTSGGIRMRINDDKFRVALERLVCALRARSDVISAPGTLNCSCPRGCHSKIYSRSISAAPWPRVDYQIGFLDRYIRNTSLATLFPEYIALLQDFMVNNGTNGEEVLNQLSSWTKLEKNFLQVNILLARPSHEVVSEQPVITWETILSNIGGTFNLWIGISFFTCMEVVELFLHLLGLLCRSELNTVRATNVKPVKS